MFVHIVVVIMVVEGIGLVEVDNEFGIVVAAVVDIEFDIVSEVESDKLANGAVVEKRTDLSVMEIVCLVFPAVK